MGSHAAKGQPARLSGRAANKQRKRNMNAGPRGLLCGLLSSAPLVLSTVPRSTAPRFLIDGRAKRVLSICYQSRWVFEMVACKVTVQKGQREWPGTQSIYLTEMVYMVSFNYFTYAIYPIFPNIMLLGSLASFKTGRVPIKWGESVAY